MGYYGNMRLTTIGKGVGWRSTGQPQTRTGDTDSGLSAEFTEHGWSNRGLSILVEYNYESDEHNRQHNGWWMKVYAKLKAYGDSDTVETRLLYKCKVDMRSIVCPMCDSGINRVGDKWKCNNNTCTLNYTDDSCAVLANTDEKFKPLALNKSCLVIEEAKL